MTLMTILKHHLRLAKAPPKHMMEREPRYDVMLNGEQVGELYYNMRGYRGAIPLITGQNLDPGEISISAWKKEIAYANAHAKKLLADLATASHHIWITRPTEDERKIFTISYDREGKNPQGHLVYKGDFERIQGIFGGEISPIALEHLDLAEADCPAVLFGPGDDALIEQFPAVSKKVVDVEADIEASAEEGPTP